MTVEAYRFPVRLGGNLCLDFTNTVEFRASEREIEFLRSYDHLAAWCVASAAPQVDEQPEPEIERQRARQFQRALDLRAALYGIFTAIIAGDQPTATDLATLNQALAGVQRRLEAHGSGFAWAWSQPGLLAPISLAAADLLTSPDLERVRQCPNCGWLFVDTSRNHSRRWCSMDFCGSQVKSRRQYERRKSAQS